MAIKCPKIKQLYGGHTYNLDMCGRGRARRRRTDRISMQFLIIIQVLGVKSHKLGIH